MRRPTNAAAFVSELGASRMIAGRPGIDMQVPMAIEAETGIESAIVGIEENSLQCEIVVRGLRCVLASAVLAQTTIVLSRPEILASNLRGPIMARENLADAFYAQMRDILSAERQLVKALPKMVEAASSPELKAAFDHHLAETKTQVDRVEQAFEDTGKAPRAEACAAMEGLIEEAEHLLEEHADPNVKDAMLIAMAQKVEHYEIATYGTLCTWAEKLGYRKALSLLKQNIAEEETADETLSKLAETINVDAMAAK
jgi:ferritin-like metal-binding protein YciE